MRLTPTSSSHFLAFALLVLTTLVSAARSQSHLVANAQSIPLTAVSVDDGEAVESDDRLSTSSWPERPHLIMYVPATISARDCIYNLVTPLQQSEDSLLAFKVTNILDVSNVNALLRWLVVRYYKQDVLATANERATFYIDYKGTARETWDLQDETCAYTLLHPGYAPLTGIGSPSRAFLNRLLLQLSKESGNREPAVDL